MGGRKIMQLVKKDGIEAHTVYIYVHLGVKI